LRKSLLFALTLLLVVSVGTAFARELPAEIIIGWSPPDITGVFATATDFFERAATDARAAGINVRIITQSPAAHTDYGAQVAILEDFIARGVDAIVVSPTDVEVVKPALWAAHDAGIPVVVVNLLEPIEDVNVTSYVGFNNFDAAAVSAYALLDYLGGPGVLGEGEMIDDVPDFLDLDFWKELYKDVDPAELNLTANVAILEGVAGDFFSNQRILGFHSVIDPHPGINVLMTLPADWNRQKGVRATEDILQAHGDKLDIIYAASNEMGIGATYPIEAAGLQDQIKVITNDGTPESVDMIRAGQILAETWHGFPDWGWYGTRFGVMAALGLEVPYQFDIRPRIIYEGNADLFYPNVALEPHPWEEIIEAYKGQ